MPARSTSIIEDNNGQPLAEEHSILKQWKEYCQELHNYPIRPDHKSVIKTKIIEKLDELSILKSEVQDAIPKR